jgi:hypothetical protein
LVCLLQGFSAAAGVNPPAGKSSYVLADSIGYGLFLDGFEAKLQAQLGAPARISYDGGRSITTPGNQIKKSALQSVEADRALIAKAGVIIIILGMNQLEPSFEKSQYELLLRLREIAPQAQYYWVDIGATIAPQVAGWNVRNKLIYENAPTLGYRVISRYKAIFGASADPLRIVAGQNFPGWGSEEGYGGPGNLHGFNAELSNAILQKLADVQRCALPQDLSTYVLGDSIAFGLHTVGFQASLADQLGGVAKISYDVGRSISSPGLQIKQSALQSAVQDRAFIAQADIIIVILGTNQTELSFADSQRELLQQLKSIAPKARYYWVDIGATLASQALSWSVRNQIIYNQAPSLGYQVISRYKAIFGEKADPLHILPGQIFPDSITEPGYDTPGNVHGKSPELARAILAALPGAACAALK